MADSDAKEASSQAASDETKPSATMSEMEKRLFNIRMKMNQGRKANKVETENEFRALSGEAKGRPPRERETTIDEDLEGTGEADGAAKPARAAGGKSFDGKGAKDRKKAVPDYMNSTVADSEAWKDKQRQKQENMHTFGWQSYNAESAFRSYEKSVEKFGRGSDGATARATENEQLLYGANATKVTKAGLSRLEKQITSKEEERNKMNRRRMHFETSDVDYINDANAQFNKKIKKSFDKYTVEIRQNLERGTAI